MNEEQNSPENGSETVETGEGSTHTADNTAQSQAFSNSEDAAPQDDYYAVDYAKKEVISTIGDGEMHDEGLVGAGDLSADAQSSEDRLSDEQDAAEFHDSEG